MIALGHSFPEKKYSRLSGASAEPLRVFVSYANVDKRIAVEIISHLQALQCDVRDYTTFPRGRNFHRIIKKEISNSHIVAVILTSSRTVSPWVHQEVGFALALAIPVLPITIDSDAGAGFLSEINGIRIESDRLSQEIDEKITSLLLNDVLNNADEEPFSVMEIKRFPFERSHEIGRLAKNIEIPAVVRQKAALSSFSIPMSALNDQIWSRYKGEMRFNDIDLEHLRSERISLQRHAIERGARLIICLTRFHHWCGDTAFATRLNTLKDFLGDCKELEISCLPEKPDENLTIVGDAFFAESRSPHIQGYKDTFISWHAPSVRKKIEDFDVEFSLGNIISKATAGEMIEQIIGGVYRHPSREFV